MTPIEIIYTVFLVILCSTTVESILWSYTVYIHCLWSKSTELIGRKNISYNSLMLFSGASGVSCFVFWIAFIFMACSIPAHGHYWVSFTIVLVFQVVVCHAWHLISTFLMIPIEHVPFMSNFFIHLSNKLLRNGYKITSMPIDLWEDIHTDLANQKALIVNLADIVPDLVWAKDINDRFTYVNNAVCRDLLISPEKDVLYKTSIEIAETLRGRGISYTFGELCEDTDKTTKDRGKPSVFYEYGSIDGRLLVIRVLKSPIFDNESNLLGTVGVARDITLHVETYDKMDKLFQADDCEGAKCVFYTYKRKFDSMMDVIDLDQFQKGMR